MEEMVQHLLMRTAVSWNTVISACEKGVQWDGDPGLLQERPAQLVLKIIALASDSFCWGAQLG